MTLPEMSTSHVGHVHSLTRVRSAISCTVSRCLKTLFMPAVFLLWKTRWQIGHETAPPVAGYRRTIPLLPSGSRLMTVVDAGVADVPAVAVETMSVGGLKAGRDDGGLLQLPACLFALSKLLPMSARQLQQVNVIVCFVPRP